MPNLMRRMKLVALLGMLGCTFEGSGQSLDAALVEDDLRVFLMGRGYTAVPMVRLSTGHFSVSGSADEVTLDLIVDTGASHTLLDTERVGRFGIRTVDEGSRATGVEYANQSVESGRLDNVAVGAVRMETLRVTVVDLSQVNRVLQRMGDGQVDGILGSDALVAREAVIDYGNRSLYLKE